MSAARAKTKYSYNVARRRYETAGGRVVPLSRVTQLLDSSIRDSQERMRALTAQLKANEINLAQWQLSMEAEVKTIHTLAAATARGGWSAMSLSDWGRVGRLTRTHYDHLNRWALEIESGRSINIGRANLYARAARTTFMNFAAQMRAAASGGIRARRVLSSAEHCAGCVREAARGYVTFELLAPIGSQECMVNCRCSIEFEE